MAKKTAPLLPASEELLRRFGDRLRLARQRRRLTARQVAERAGMAPMTLRGIERGGAGGTIGAYLAVMQVLGVDKDLDMLASADPLGRELQDARLPARAVTASPEKAARDTPAKGKRLSRAPAKAVLEWRGGGFESSRALANLVTATASAGRKKR